MSKLIYTDYCSQSNVTKIKNDLGFDVLLRLEKDKWNINDSISVITSPDIVLAVINTIDEISVMEIALLNFLCKPILVTYKGISNYQVIEKRVIDYVDLNCNLKEDSSNFVSWYKMKYGV